MAQQSLKITSQEARGKWEESENGLGDEKLAGKIFAGKNGGRRRRRRRRRWPAPEKVAGAPAGRRRRGSLHGCHVTAWSPRGEPRAAVAANRAATRGTVGPRGRHLLQGQPWGDTWQPGGPRVGACVGPIGGRHVAGQGPPLTWQPAHGPETRPSPWAVDQAHGPGLRTWSTDNWTDGRTGGPGPDPCPTQLNK